MAVTENSPSAPEFLRFVDALAGFGQVIKEYRPRLTVEISCPTPTKVTILARLIFSELNELHTICQMAAECISAMYATRDQLEMLRGTVPLGDVDPTTPTGSIYSRVISGQMESSRRVSIHMKTMYEWLFHLRELIRTDPQIKDLIAGPPWDALRSACVFRNKLITHKQNAGGYLETGPVRYGDTRIELTIISFKTPQSAIDEVHGVFQSVAGSLTSEEAAEENFFEQCSILYRNLHRLSDQRVQIESLIERYGTSSASASELVGQIRDLAGLLLGGLGNLINAANLQ